MQQEQQPFFLDKLVQELRRLCQEKQSGTLFVTTEEQHSVRFVIQDGAISDITYRTKHGLDAISFIKNITGGTYTFSGNRVFLSSVKPGSAPLPSTVEIFRLLSAPPQVLASPTPSNPRVATPPVVPTSPDVSTSPVIGLFKVASPLPESVGGNAGAPAKKILVVDDSDFTRKLIVKALRDGGYTVVEAQNGLAAFARLNEENPDLMLLDIVMPGIDGYKVLSMVRKHETFKNLPIIMLTSRDSLLDKLRGKMGGSDEYLTKPFTPSQLLEKINKHLNR